MKLIIQIPCYDEEKTLPLVIQSIPKHITGVDSIETLIIDDGSTDKTSEIARQLEITHIVTHKKNMGLSASFSDGIDACLKYGADIIVNTDGDNQYPQKNIGILIQPILDGKADIVVGNRQVETIAHFSPLKKFLQKIGSHVVTFASGTHIPDAPSGFRAYSREAALATTLITSFSYTIESLIQASKKGFIITHVPITTNPKTRESRLFGSMFEHVRKSMITILRVYTMYEPFKVFLTTGSILFTIGILPYLRFLFLIIKHQMLISGHVQSLIVGAVLMIVGILIVLIGIISDLLAINRKLLEDTLRRIKNLEYKKDETRK